MIEVSIIIPVYNRAHLIGETLDSILSQTYEKWECIVVDDGSTDETYAVLKEYLTKDDRIRIYSRPESKVKGANSCRNFGFQKSRGDYIIWFDSDDIMHKDHIRIKIGSIQNFNVDYVIAKTQNFKGKKMLEPYKYERKSYGIRASDFILLKIHWYTYDVMLKREVAEQISWNERMRSWQDYNYFCKMVLKTEEGEYLDEILTYRRLHNNSIQQSMNSNPLKFNSELLENRIYTYKDIENKLDPYTKTELVYGMMNLSFEIAKEKRVPAHISLVKKIVSKELGVFALFNFNFALFLVKITGKGYHFLSKAKSRKA